jgi:hypothetical protein
LIHNRGKKHTFVSHLGASIIDITVSRNLNLLVENWAVNSSSFISDHKPITFEIKTFPWEKISAHNYAKADWYTFNESVKSRCPEINESEWSETKIYEQLLQLYEIINHSLDKSCPTRILREWKVPHMVDRGP